MFSNTTRMSVPLKNFDEFLKKTAHHTKPTQITRCAEDDYDKTVLHAKLKNVGESVTLKSLRPQRRPSFGCARSADLSTP